MQLSFHATLHAYFLTPITRGTLLQTPPTPFYREAEPVSIQQRLGTENSVFSSQPTVTRTLTTGVTLRLMYGRRMGSTVIPSCS